MSEYLFGIGVLLVLAGFVLAFIVAVTAGIRGRARGGGVILVGPVPIVFGTDRRITCLLLMCAVLLLVVFFALGMLAGR